LVNKLIQTLMLVMLMQLTISPVRRTVSPSLTRRSVPNNTTPTWPASRFMHIPLTPEANLCHVRDCARWTQGQLKV
jgi:hypothetical protein